MASSGFIFVMGDICYGGILVTVRDIQVGTTAWGGMYGVYEVGSTGSADRAT